MEKQKFETKPRYLKDENGNEVEVYCKILLANKSTRLKLKNIKINDELGCIL